jgi:hypothetical protein
LETLFAAERAIQEHFADSTNERGNQNQNHALQLQKELLPIQTNIKWTMQRQGDANVWYTGYDFFSLLNNNKKPLGYKDMPANVTPLQKRIYHYNQAILALQTTNNNYPLVKLNRTMLLKTLYNSAATTNYNDPSPQQDADDNDEQWWRSRVHVLEARMLDQ